VSIRKKFNELLGLTDSVEEEKKCFVERVNQAVFHQVDTEDTDYTRCSELFEVVCFELGVDSHTFRPREGMGLQPDLPPKIKTLTKSDFTKTLEALCAMYQHIGWLNYPNEDIGQEWLSQMIELILSKCTCDIGVRWKDGFFYPSGAEELDKPLIGETLHWLRDYPSEKRDYRAALRNYMVGDSLADVVKNCYSAVEGVARNILKNDKTLDNNKDALLRKIGLSDGWKAILGTYINYAHDYRHASEQRHAITKQEAEAYLYMTGLIIRLTIESRDSSN